MKEITIAIVLAIAIAGLLAATGVLNNEDVEAQPQESILCPAGYTECTGVPISEPTPDPTVEPTVIVVPTAKPTPTETRFSCRHTHEHDSDWPDGEFIHYGYNHINPNEATGVFGIYDSEKCGHYE